jgi:hypothetical protein
MKTNLEFTLEEFLAWALTKDPNESYDYCDPFECPVATFIKETRSIESVSVGPGVVFDDTYLERFEFDTRIERALNIPSGEFENEVETYSGLVARLEVSGMKTSRYSLRDLGMNPRIPILKQYLELCRILPRSSS